MSEHHLENHHGVMMRIHDFGVLILGKPNIGKSSLALELLHHGHQLIADDSVEFQLNADRNVVATCPEMLIGLLHCRDLGLINVQEVFGSQAYREQQKLDFVVELKESVDSNVSLAPSIDDYLICGQAFAKLNLITHSPASVVHRLLTWIKIQTSSVSAATILSQRQTRHMMIQ